MKREVRCRIGAQHRFGVAQPATHVERPHAVSSAPSPAAPPLISGGTQIDSGLASRATPFGGSQVVRNAGTAIRTTVSNSGTEAVGTLEVASGATASGVVFRPPACLSPTCGSSPCVNNYVSPFELVAAQ